MVKASKTRVDRFTAAICEQCCRLRAADTAMAASLQIWDAPVSESL